MGMICMNKILTSAIITNCVTVSTTKKLNIIYWGERSGVCLVGFMACQPLLGYFILKSV